MFVKPDRQKGFSPKLSICGQPGHTKLLQALSTGLKACMSCGDWLDSRWALMPFCSLHL